MLHLEDYLEMIEHLPQELRDRFTEMREMDLSVQNNTDALDKRARLLFKQCARGELPTAMADAEFDAIRNDYYRVLEDSDEKIQLAAQMYDLVERYQRRLDNELYKFKCELEADHNGITEILEKRSLELDNSATTNGSTNQKENRFYDAHSYSGTPMGRSDSRYKLKAVKRRESMAVTAAEKRNAAASVASAAAIAGASASTAITGASTAPLANAHIRPTTPGTVGANIGAAAIGAHPVVASATSEIVSPYNLQICAAGNAIAAAASQAIAQTQQMQQGRRTASLKASYEAIGIMGSQDLLINCELVGATHNALQAVERESSVFSNQRRQKKKNVSSSFSPAIGIPNVRTTTTTTILPSNATGSPMITAGSQLSQAPFASVTLQVQQPALQQQQLGTVPGQQSQTGGQQQPLQSASVPTTTQFTAHQQPIAVPAQIQLHHANSQVPLQHLPQTSHQQQLLQQLAVQSPQSQIAQTPPLKQQLHSPQLQMGCNQQQKHLILPQASPTQQRLQRPQQPQQFQSQSIAPQLMPQQPQQAITPMQTQQQQLLHHLPLQSISPKLLQSQTGHASALSQPSQPQLQLQQQIVHPNMPQKQQLLSLKPLQSQSIQPLAQTPQQHIVQQQVVHLQSQQHQLLQPLQQHQLQISQQQLLPQQPQQSPQQLAQLQVTQQQQLQQKQQSQQLQFTQQQQQQQQQQLLDLQQKETQLQPTLQHQQQQMHQQVQPHLIQQHQQPQLSAKGQAQQQGALQQQQQTQSQQQQFVGGHAASNLLTNTSAIDLLATPSTSTNAQGAGGTSSTGTNSSAAAANNNAVTLTDSGMVVEQTPEGEWSYDPNEPRYCICNQVSYGDMVACDNEGCPFEWFHYPCVNITSSPKGKWYCPQCSSSMKRRASRKN